MEATTINEMEQVAGAIPGWVVPVAVGAAVCVAVVAGLAVWFNRRRTPIERLTENQKTFDTLRSKDIGAWANSHRGELKEGTKMAIMRATPARLRQLGYRDGGKLNAKQNIVACIIDLVNGKVITIQLFSFETMDDDLAARFGKEEVFFLEE